jgi:hypothetical protein
MALIAWFFIYPVDAEFFGKPKVKVEPLIVSGMLFHRLSWPG